MSGSAGMQVYLRVFVNDCEVTTSAVTLEDLVNAQGHGGSRVATARNGDFVPARARTTTRLADGDRIEIVSARQGG